MQESAALELTHIKIQHIPLEVAPYAIVGIKTRADHAIVAILAHKVETAPEIIIMHIIHSQTNLIVVNTPPINNLTQVVTERKHHPRTE